jgi:hypothetical protein
MMSTKKSNKKASKEPKEIKIFREQIGKKPYGSLQISRFPGVGFPDQLRCTLRYSDAGSQFTGSIAPAAQVFRANSLFDPDLTGSGSQPEYFDQLSAVYGQYCVQGCRFKAEIFNTGTTSNICVLLYSDANIATQSVENMTEHRYAKHAAVSAKGGMDRVTITLPPILNSTLQGERNLNSDANNYQGIGVNPADPTYAIFRTSSMDNATNSNIYVNFYLEYDCWFKELTPVVES